MISIFQRKTRPYVSLDMNSDEMRLLRYQPFKAGFRIENYAFAPLPKGAVIDGKIHQFDTLLAMTKKLVKQTETQGCHALMAVPSHAVSAKRIKLNAGMNNKERQREIYQNLSHYFPAQAEELCFDFSVMNVVEPSQEDVLVVASTQALIHSYVMIATLAGLNVKIVDVDFYAEKRALAWHEMKKPILMEALDSQDFVAKQDQLRVCLGLAMRRVSA